MSNNEFKNDIKWKNNSKKGTEAIKNLKKGV